MAVLRHDCVMHNGRELVASVRGSTWLAAVHGANTGRRVLAPSSTIFSVLLDGPEGNSKPVPDALADKGFFFSGTFGMIGRAGQPLDVIMSTCNFAGRGKQVFVEPPKEYAGSVDTLLLCNHGFLSDGSPTLQLLHPGSRRPITTDAEMNNTDTLLLQLNGAIQTVKVARGQPSLLWQLDNGEQTGIVVADAAAVRLLRHMIRVESRRAAGRHTAIFSGSSRELKGDSLFVLSSAAGTQPPVREVGFFVIQSGPTRKVVIKGVRADQVDPLMGRLRALANSDPAFAAAVVQDYQPGQPGQVMGGKPQAYESMTVGVGLTIEQDGGTGEIVIRGVKEGQAAQLLGVVREFMEEL